MTHREQQERVVDAQITTRGVPRTVTLHAAWLREVPAIERDLSISGMYIQSRRLLDRHTRTSRCREGSSCSLVAPKSSFSRQESSFSIEESSFSYKYAPPRRMPSQVIMFFKEIQSPSCFLQNSALFIQKLSFEIQYLCRCDRHSSHPSTDTPATTSDPSETSLVVQKRQK